MANLRTNNLCGEGGRNAYNGSVFFQGDKSYLALASGVVPSFGTGDFTVEFWINQGVNASNYTVLFALTSSTPSDRLEVAIHSSTIQVYTDTGAWRDTGYAPVSGVYEHIVFQRDYSGNTLKMYANGVEKWSVSNTRDYDEAWTTQIGSYASSSYGYFEGYISNFRICIGHTVYSSNNFTPPTSPLTVHYTAEDDKTVLLCCQDSDDPTQEATGKTITAFGNLQSGDDVNLITNGGFLNDLSSWTVGQGTVVYNAGKAHMTGTSGNSLEQNVTTVVGKRYRMTATVDNTANVDYNVGIEFGGVLSYVQSSTITTGSRTFHIDFTATSTTTLADLWGGTAVTGYWDNVSVKLLEPPKAPKVIPPFGTDAGNTFNGGIAMNTLDYMYFPTGRTEERGRGRAVLFQGISDSSTNYSNNIDFIEISTLGNSMRFGDLGNYVGLGAAISSTTRGVFAGGTRPAASPFSGGNQNFLEYVTIATTGNGQDFGGVSTLFRYGAGISNSTRGLICGAYQGGGASGTLNTIQYLTIASLGNTFDFGAMENNSGNGVQGMGATSSSTRGITFGGGTPTTIAEIEYITISTLGNSQTFGDLSSNRYLCQGVSNGTRGVVGGGDNSGAVNIIEFVTIASTGDATDFGDLSSISEHAGGTGGSNKIRGVFVGRGDWTEVDNSMSYITIATTGNAQDFGDIRTGLQNYGTNALPDSHGGL